MLPVRARDELKGVVLVDTHGVACCVMDYSVCHERRPTDCCTSWRPQKNTYAWWISWHSNMPLDCTVQSTFRFAEPLTVRSFCSFLVDELCPVGEAGFQVACARWLQDRVRSWPWKMLCALAIHELLIANPSALCCEVPL